MYRLRSLPLILTILAATNAHAAVPDDLVYTPPMQNGALSGLILNNSSDTEYLTPLGIVDDMPESTIEPAAGPPEQEPSATIPPLNHH